MTDVSLGLVQLGSLHKNGERIVGRETGQVEKYYRAGTPMCNQMLRSSVTSAMAGVRVDDELSVEFDGKFWWALRDGEVVGRLTWSLSLEEPKEWMDYTIVLPRAGRMIVTQVTLTPDDVVTNCGGIVYPA